MIFWNKSGTLFGLKIKIIFGLIGLAAILLGFVISFITVKIINYTQPKNSMTSNGEYDRFTIECTNLVKKWTDFGIQTRVDDPLMLKVSKIPIKADVFAVHSSHTSTFLGLVVDALHKVGPYPFSAGDDKICSGTLPLVNTWTRVDCFDRIGNDLFHLIWLGNKTTDCGEIRTK